LSSYFYNKKVNGRQDRDNYLQHLFCIMLGIIDNTNITPAPLHGPWKWYSVGGCIVWVLSMYRDGCIVEVVCWRVYRIVESTNFIFKNYVGQNEYVITQLSKYKYIRPQ